MFESSFSYDQRFAWQPIEPVLMILSNTSAGPVLNVPVWNYLFSCPVLMLWSVNQRVLLKQFYNILSLWIVCVLDVVCRALTLWCRVKLEHFVFILPGLSAVGFKVNVFIIWNRIFDIILHVFEWFTWHTLHVGFIRRVLRNRHKRPNTTFQNKSSEIYLKIE